MSLRAAIAAVVSFCASFDAEVRARLVVAARVAVVCEEAADPMTMCIGCQSNR